MKVRIIKELNKEIYKQITCGKEIPFLKELETEWKYRTNKAILFKIGEKEVWIPESQIHWRGNAETHPVYITEWIAKQKNLI